MTEFLREEVYRHDGIAFHSKRWDVLPAQGIGDDLAAAVLRPEFPLVVVVHDEAECQMRNPFEEALIAPVLRALADPAKYGLDAIGGLGIVVPHRAQRAALQQSFPELCLIDPVKLSFLMRIVLFKYLGIDEAFIVKQMSEHHRLLQRIFYSKEHPESMKAD